MIHNILEEPQSLFRRLQRWRVMVDTGSGCEPSRALNGAMDDKRRLSSRHQGRERALTARHIR
jgi:hypothetical protein